MSIFQDQSIEDYNINSMFERSEIPIEHIVSNSMNSSDITVEEVNERLDHPYQHNSLLLCYRDEAFNTIEQNDEMSSGSNRTVTVKDEHHENESLVSTDDDFAQFASPTPNLFDESDDEDENSSELEIPTELSSRKLADDSIRKKIKVKICENIKIRINKKIRKIHGKKTKLQLKKLPQAFIKNVHLQVNKTAIKMTIKQLFCKNFNTNGEIDKKLIWNEKVINSLEELQKKTPILNLTFLEVIEQYFGSKYYEKDLEKIKQKENETYARQYDKLVRGYCDTLSYIQYFMDIPANQQRI